MPAVKNKFDIRLRELKLSNFRRFEELSLSFDRQLTVFIGRNGVGKSTVLDGIASLLKFLIDKIKKDPVNLKGMLKERDIRNGTREAVNTLTIYFEKENAEEFTGRGDEKSKDVNAETGVELTWYGSLTKAGFDPEEITEANAFTDFDTVVSAIEKQLKRDEPSSLPIIAYYPCDYATDSQEFSNGETTSTEAFNAYDDSLSTRSFDFKQFARWYKWREDLARDAKNGRDRLKEVTEQAVCGILTDEQNKYLTLKTRALSVGIGYELTILKNKELISVDQFSSGEKMLFRMVADIARRLALANPGVKNPLEGNGIVLIDEIDLHLHPSKQREVLPKLLDIFKNVQFVVTTHSPTVLSQIHSNHILVLEDGKVFSASDTLGQEVATILDKVMETPYIYQEELNTIFDLIALNKVEDAEKAINELDSKIEGSLPELARAKAIIKRKQLLAK